MTERCDHGIEPPDCPLCEYARGVVDGALRGCPCDDGDGEGCPVHGIGADLPASSSSDRSKVE